MVQVEGDSDDNCTHRFFSSLPNDACNSQTVLFRGFLLGWVWSQAAKKAESAKSKLLIVFQSPDGTMAKLMEGLEG